ncbi:hypothetical protein O181_009726 [Austropuccinia psidii MF-1]|uniref:Uncharacterized protein n=1 Tax=Austropuccinia psidii MF-1 TaxID=1389203 RepID=A0A9Q3BPS7_9BASI|nr:hypothetical protein [Austropuccinia psidii MF-1]
MRCQMAIQEYRGNMTIIYKEGRIHTHSDGLSRWPLGNVKRSPAYDPDIAPKISIHFMEIDRKKWAPGSCTPDINHSGQEGKETYILETDSSEIHNQFFNSVIKMY